MPHRLSHPGAPGSQVLKSINISCSPERKGAQSACWVGPAGALLPLPFSASPGPGALRGPVAEEHKFICPSWQHEAGTWAFSRSPRTHRVRWVTAEIRFTSRSLVLLSPHNSVTFCFLFGIPEFSQYGYSQIPDFRALADLGPQSTLHGPREWKRL